jgi:uncharacterized tellurite resistance protein B-like protein
MTGSSAAAEIGLCLLLCAADGEISDEELGALTSRIGQLLGDDLAPVRLSAMVDGELSSIADLGADEYVVRLRDRIPEGRRVEAVEAACSIACADGLSPEEEEMLRLAGKVLDVDVDRVIERVGRQDTVHAPSPDDAHDDEPDATTALIADRLGARGWADPMKQLRDAGIKVGGFGAIALEYEAPNRHVLRLEHHTCDGSLHLHVTDDSDMGADFVLFADGREGALIEAIVAQQDLFSLDRIEEQIGKLMEVARVCVVRDGELTEMTR